jgi:hypothetical protein
MVQDKVGSIRVLVECFEMAVGQIIAGLLAGSRLAPGPPISGRRHCEAADKVQHSTDKG